MQIWPWCRNEPQAPADAAPGHVRVVQHDQRRVAAQFQVHPLEMLAGQRADVPADRGRAGERDDPHHRVGDQRLARVRAAGQHVQQPVGQAGLLEHPGQHHAAA